MTSLVVADSSALVAALIDSGATGSWAADILTGASLAAPALLPFDAANILRRHAAAGLISGDLAAQAYVDLQQFPIELWPFELLSERVWQLRDNLTCYDASYVAVAEIAGGTLATLDLRMGRAPGLRCPVVHP